jgi:hypothetical protein
MGYWGTVHKAAFIETRELVRLDNPGRALVTLALIVVPAIAGFVLSHSLDPISRGGISFGALLLAGALIYAWKLVAIPPRLSKEAAAKSASELEAAVVREHLLSNEAKKRENELSYNLTRIQDELTAVHAPKQQPSIDPDGVYQFGKKVGSVTGAQLRAGGVFTFTTIAVRPEFRPGTFEYRDYVLEVTQANTTTRVRTAGQPEMTVYNSVTCQIVGGG